MGGRGTQMIRIEHCDAILICILRRFEIKDRNEYLDLKRFGLGERGEGELADETLVAGAMRVPFYRLAGRRLALLVEVGSFYHEKRHECYE